MFSISMTICSVSQGNIFYLKEQTQLWSEVSVQNEKKKNPHITETTVTQNKLKVIILL